MADNPIARAAADQAEDVLSKKGVKFFKAYVHSINFNNGKYKIRKPENTDPEPVEYPMVSAAYKPAVGDLILCLAIFGGVIVLGTIGIPNEGQLGVRNPTGGEALTITDTDAQTQRSNFLAFYNSSSARQVTYGVGPQGQALLTSLKFTESGQDIWAPNIWTNAGISLSSRAATSYVDYVDGRVTNLGTYAENNYTKYGHNHDGRYAWWDHGHNYAAANHNHDGRYAWWDHSHSGWAPAGAVYSHWHYDSAGGYTSDRYYY
jgi:hypothetical protein